MLNDSYTEQRNENAKTGRNWAIKITETKSALSKVSYSLRSQHYELTSTPELLTLAAYISKDGLVGHHWKVRPIGLANFICPCTGERQGQKGGVGGLGSGGGWVWGTFGIALEM
jgi:hypothetical protein